MIKLLLKHFRRSKSLEMNKWLGKDGAFFGEGFTKEDGVYLLIGAVVMLILILTGVIEWPA
jgi:hypothetical protein